MNPIFSYTINGNLIWVDLREVYIMQWDSAGKYGEVFMKGSDAEVKFSEEAKRVFEEILRAWLDFNDCPIADIPKL